MEYKREPLEEDEILLLRKSCVNFEEELVINLLLDTGMRVSELANLKEENISWQRNIVESLISAVKRLFGVHLRARTWRAQRAEINSRLISYNIGAIIQHYFLQSHKMQNL